MPIAAAVVGWVVGGLLAPQPGFTAVTAAGRVTSALLLFLLAERYLN